MKFSIKFNLQILTITQERHLLDATGKENCISKTMAEQADSTILNQFIQI